MAAFTSYPIDISITVTASRSGRALNRRLQSSLKFICRRFTVAPLSPLRPNHLDVGKPGIPAAAAAAVVVDGDEDVPMIAVAGRRR